LYFYSVTNNTVGKTGKKEKVERRKELFLTYTGILRVLFVSRGGCANTFIKWATEKLFTLQMGTLEQKQKLVSTAFGVPTSVVKEVFRTNATSVSCIYMFILGTVKALRKSMNIDDKYPDDMLIVKFGRSEDLARRAGEHAKKFGKIKGVEVKLMYYCYIDPLYNSAAETDIKNYFESLGAMFNYKDNAEMVIISPAMLKPIGGQFELISTKYAGHVKDLVKQLEDLKKSIELRDEKEKVKLLERDNRINMLEKDLEIEKLKYQLATKRK
jgi:hypothetical protein